MARISLTQIGYALQIVAAAVLWMGLQHGDTTCHIVSLMSALVLIVGARRIFQYHL